MTKHARESDEGREKKPQETPSGMTELEKRWAAEAACEKSGPEAPGEAPKTDLPPAGELKKKLQEAEEKALRIAADFENSKKRMRKQFEDSVKFANEKILQDVLPLIDDLDRAIASLDQGHDAKSVQEGLHMVQENFHRVLQQNGVEEIESLGKPFDPHFHEAVGVVLDDAAEEGRVVDEIQRGYLLNGRLARPSKVRIAKKRDEA